MECVGVVQDRAKSQPGSRRPARFLGNPISLLQCYSFCGFPPDVFSLFVARIVLDCTSIIVIVIRTHALTESSVPKVPYARPTRDCMRWDSAGGSTPREPPRYTDTPSRAARGPTGLFEFCLSCARCVRADCVRCVRSVRLGWGWGGLELGCESKRERPPALCAA